MGFISGKIRVYRHEISLAVSVVQAVVVLAVAVRQYRLMK